MIFDRMLKEGYIKFRNYPVLIMFSAFSVTCAPPVWFGQAYI